MKLRKLIKIAVVVSLYAISMLILNNVEAVEISDGVYSIKSSMNADYAIDVRGVSVENCANIELWQNKNGKNQQYEFKKVDDKYYTIKALHSGKYLDVENAGTYNGANIIQYAFHGGDNQKWEIKQTSDGYYCIVSKLSGLYMDIENAAISNGSNVLTYAFHNGGNQKFILDRVDSGSNLKDGLYKIVCAKDSKYILDVKNKSKENCGDIELWSDNNGNNQKFNIKNIGNGCYTICALNSGKYLDVDNAGKYNGANVIQYAWHGGENQKWIIKDVGNGEYNIISKLSNLCMDVQNGAFFDGANVQTWTSNGTNAQKFKFIATTVNNDYVDAEVVEDNGRSAQFKREHPEIKVGIDVSRYQGKIDWSLVKKDGIDYAMIRAGFRGYGASGSLNEDTMFEENVKGARAAGLDVGVYFFSQAKNYDEGVKEAEYTIGLIKKFDITYPVAFDTEQSSSPTNTGRADNISDQDRTDAAKGFCSTIKAAGYKTLIYASPSWLKDNLYLDQLSEYDIWLANYTGATQEDPLKRPSNYKGKYVMWQYTDSGTVNGINGKVDCDLFYYLKMD